MGLLTRDLRLGLRTLRRQPSVTLVAMATLALALGAGIAIFTVVDAILLRPLPFPAAEELLMVGGRGTVNAGGGAEISHPNFIDLREGTTTLSQVAAYYQSTTFLYGSEEPELVRGIEVSADIFALLGVTPQVGRAFTADEDRPGAAPVIVLGHDFWQRRFGGDASIIGRPVRIGSSEPTVVGVLPPRVAFPANVEHRDYWAPLGPDLPEGLSESRGAVFLDALARRRSGATLQQVAVDLERLSRALEKEYPAANTDYEIFARPLHEAVVGDLRPALLLLAAAVTAVLLIGCANVANLLLARGAARAREMAVRTALGATRARLVMQLLLESVLLALVAGVIGLLLAAWGVDLLLALAPDDLPRLEAVHLDGRVVLFGLFLSLATGIGFGLVPALTVSGTHLVEALKDGSRGATEGRDRGRLRAALVVAELALSIVLLGGAGLLIRSFLALSAVEAGYDHRDVATMALSVRSAHEDISAVHAFQRRLLDELAAIPGVESVAASRALPLAPGEMTLSYEIAGRPRPLGQEPAAVIVQATPGLLRTLRIPLLRGRDLAPSDTADAPPVMLVNESFAAAEFPGDDPLGKRIDVADGDGQREIVGVVGDVRYADLAAAAQPTFYLSALQQEVRYLRYVVRSARAATLEPELRAAVRRLDPAQPIVAFGTLDELRRESLGNRRLILVLLTVLAGLALTLAAIGIYSVMSFTVSRRTSEIGIRMALGADPGDVNRMILRHAASLVALGAAIGLALTFAGARLVRTLLFGVGPSDPTALAATTVVLAATALAASWLPAQRAARVDPLVAIRHE